MAIDVCEILTSEVRRAFGCGGGLQSLLWSPYEILHLTSNVGLPFMYLIQVKFSLCCVLFVLYFVVLSDFTELTNILFYSFLFLGTQCAEMKLESFFLLIMFIHRTLARERWQMRKAFNCSWFAWTASTFPFFCLFGKIFVNNKQRREEIHK